MNCESLDLRDIKAKHQEMIDDAFKNDYSLEEGALTIIGCNGKFFCEIGYELIADTFANHFAHWNFTIPEKDLKARNKGYIQNSGWLIQYCFGKDETGQYMDY